MAAAASEDALKLSGSSSSSPGDGTYKPPAIRDQVKTNFWLNSGEQTDGKLMWRDWNIIFVAAGSVVVLFLLLL